MNHSEYRLLCWAEAQAKELLGVHTGGPHESAHRDKLKALRKLLLEIKPRRNRYTLTPYRDLK